MGTSSGSAYVVFGQASQGDVDLGALGSDGVRFDGARGNEALHSIVPAGDVDGDGTADILIGSQHAIALGRNNAGTAYVVYGSNDLLGLGLTSLGSDGLTVIGPQSYAGVGRAVAPGGDVDGDGFDDIVLGASAASSIYWAQGGSAYVVRGRSAHSPDLIDLAVPDPRVVRLEGTGPSHFLGNAIGEAGDLNGDGLDDVLVPATGTSFNGRGSSGSAYVLFGAPAFTAPDLTSLGAAGFRLDGAVANDQLGRGDGGSRMLRGLDDVNGDGRVDLVLTAYEASHTGGQARGGRVHVVFGSTVAYVKGKHVAARGEAFTLAPKHLTTKGATTLAIAPALPDGLSFDTATGAISGTPTAAAPATTHVVTLTDDQGVQKTTLELEVPTGPASDPGTTDPGTTDPGVTTPTGDGGATKAGGAQAIAAPAPRPAPAAALPTVTAPRPLAVRWTNATTVTLSAPATLRVTLRKVSRTKAGRKRVGKAVRLKVVRGVAGANALGLSTKGVKAGRYRLTVSVAGRVMAKRTVVVTAK